MRCMNCGWGKPDNFTQCEKCDSPLNVNRLLDYKPIIEHAGQEEVSSLKGTISERRVSSDPIPENKNLEYANVVIRYGSMNLSPMRNCKTHLSFYNAMSFLTVCLMFIIFSISSRAQSQDRSYIRQQISYHNECRNVAITKYNGDLMLYGSNGWAASGCPSGLTNALHNLNEQNEYIDDVQLTEQGGWLILYSDNGVRWNNIPYTLERKLREYNSNSEIITSVSFNDYGDWIVISTEHFSSSDSRISQWLKEGLDQYGQLWTTCVTSDAIVAVYERGYRTIGDIPSTLMRALDATTIDVYRLKIAGESWFFSDGKSRYRYNM